MLSSSSLDDDIYHLLLISRSHVSLGGKLKVIRSPDPEKVINGFWLLSNDDCRPSIEYLGGKVNQLTQDLEWNLKSISFKRHLKDDNTNGFDDVTVPIFVPFEASEQAKSLISSMNDLNLSKEQKLLPKTSSSQKKNLTPKRIPPPSSKTISNNISSKKSNSVRKNVKTTKITPSTKESNSRSPSPIK